MTQGASHRPGAGGHDPQGITQAKWVGTLRFAHPSAKGGGRPHRLAMQEGLGHNRPMSPKRRTHPTDLTGADDRASLPVAVRIHGASAGTPLTAQQQKFNRHIERIAQQRKLLAQWQQAIADYHERQAREIVPLQNSLQALTVDLVLWLDTASDRKKLAKTDRRTLSEAITSRLAPLIDVVPDEAMRERLKEIYNRHSGSDYDAEAAEGHEIAREMAQAMVHDFFGVDLDLQDVDMDSPDELLRRLHEQIQASQAQAEQEREAQHATRARKPGARERKAQEAAAQATQSVREIYRKLASRLHPDRESDPAERERKTTLMQRVNEAYAANNLLDLLQLQLEVEQIDTAHIAGLSDERLRHYNRVLADQLEELQQEVRDQQLQFAMQSGLEPRPGLKPASLVRELRAHLQSLQYQSLQLRRELDVLRADPAALKGWIKAERQRQKMQEALDAFDEPDLWF